MPEATLPVAPSFFMTTAAKNRESPVAQSHKWQKKVCFKARALTLTHSLSVAHDHLRQPATTSDHRQQHPQEPPLWTLRIPRAHQEARNSRRNTINHRPSTTDKRQIHNQRPEQTIAMRRISGTAHKHSTRKTGFSTTNTTHSGDKLDDRRNGEGVM